MSKTTNIAKTPGSDLPAIAHARWQAGPRPSASGGGSQAASGSRWLGWCALVLAAMCASSLAAIPAQATVIHKPLFQLAEVPAVGPHGEPVAIPGRLERSTESMTLDSGHVWLAEGSLFAPSRVDEFDAKTGAFIAQPMHLERSPELLHPTCYGYACGEGFAVGHGPGEAAVYVAGEQNGVSVVSVFNEAGALKATWNGAATPEGSFGVFTGFTGETVGSISDVAVDNSANPLSPGSGDVFVEVGRQFDSNESRVIDIFHPEADGEERYVGQITGPSLGEPFGYIPRMAVDEANGDLFVTENSAVDVFEPNGLGSYVFVRRLSGPPPTGTFDSIYAVAVDSATGEVYVTEAPPNAPSRIDQFSATGTYLGNVENVVTAALAVDPESHYLYTTSTVYGPDLVVPDVTTGLPSSVQPESGQLNGTVDANGAGKASCQFEWGTTPALGKSVPCQHEVEGEGATPVEVMLAGLERDTTYYYRLQASNANGTNLSGESQIQSFTTPGVVIRRESVADVSADAATFAATIDPDKQATSYYFQYGPSSAYGQTSPAAPGEAIGSGASNVEVPQLHIQGLSPDTAYYYRVVAVSEAKLGEVETVYGEGDMFTTQAAGGSFSLLDGRQWELVSPPSKMGAQIFPPGGGTPGTSGVLQAAAAGNAIVYQTNVPTNDEPQGYVRNETVLSTRGTDAEWSTQNISVPHDQEAGSLGEVGLEYRAFSPDLSRAALLPVTTEFTPLSPEASESTSYLRTDYPPGDPEAHCVSACYRPLVTGKPGYANVPSGTVFGEEPNGVCRQRVCGPTFMGGSPDLSHVILSSPAQLTETPAPAGGVYEWSAGRLRLVDVLPKGEEGPAILAGSQDARLTDSRHAVSDDGERVILEGGSSGGNEGGNTGGNGLYLREGATSEAGETIRLDALQGGAGPSAGVVYMTASSDDSRVFFVDRGHLTASSSASGEDLYEYDLNAPVGSRLSDLSVDANAGEAAEVESVIGASEDGSYVYFGASGVLAEGAKAGALNLYMRHDGVTKLIAVLPANDYEAFYNEFHGMHGRVSPDGNWLAFMSTGDLTGYDTRDAASGERDAEVYLYDAVTGRLVCASCNPTGARPSGAFVEAGRQLEGWVAASVPQWTFIEGAGIGLGTFYQSRYLSDGGRLLFDSLDALVPQDVNGTEDVYEYEPPGVGGCTASSALFAVHADGCVGLVSSGASPAESTFLDASETGGDIFFLTRSQLVPQDYDTARDVYDAQECTSVEPCASTAVQPPACTTEASCKASPTPQPALYGAPASATFSGTGNLTSSSTPVGQSRSKPKSKASPKPGKCRKNKAKHGCPKAKRAKRKARSRTRAATTHRKGKR
jgi:hypothetical protein